MINVKKIKLNILKNHIIGDCIRCVLSKSRTNIVFGEGNCNAKIVLVGEAPGRNEDLNGVPFCGRSGALINDWLYYFGIKRDDVYILNLIKCRPPNNINPEEQEINCCSSFMVKQIKIIEPSVIISLGKFSSQFLSKKPLLSMQNLRNLELSYNGIPLIPTYHPSYILRKEGKFDPIGKENSKVLKDFEKALRYVS